MMLSNDVTDNLVDAVKKLLAKNERFSGGTWDKARQALAAFEAQAAMSPKPTSGTSEPVAWVSLTANGQIAYFDGKPMVMPGPVGNDCHPTPLYTASVAQAEPWVPVAEQLPDHKGGYFDTTPCLLAWDDGTVESGWYCGKGSFQHANGDMDYHEEAKVTHWMPLPQPPKENP